MSNILSSRNILINVLCIQETWRSSAECMDAYEWSDYQLVSKSNYIVLIIYLHIYTKYFCNWHTFRLRCWQTDQAIAVPSKVDVPRPSSSRITREFGVAYLNKQETNKSLKSWKTSKFWQFLPIQHKMYFDLPLLHRWLQFS